MAVRTETGRLDGKMGEFNMVVGSISSIANNDTWQPGLRQIAFVTITPAVSGTTAGYTASGGTITFLMSTTTTCTVMVFGF